MNISNLSLKFVLIISFLSISAVCLSQEGSIRGHVYDEKTGEPVSFANVLVENTSFGTTTNDDGFFTVTGVPIGEYKLRVSFIGYEEVIMDIAFKENKINYYKINLASESVSLGAVNIRFNIYKFYQVLYQQVIKVDNYLLEGDLQSKIKSFWMD